MKILPFVLEAGHLVSKTDRACFLGLQSGFVCFIDSNE
jgi:hypothetical protein